MKLLLVFAFLAVVSLARSIPTPSAPGHGRVLDRAHDVHDEDVIDPTNEIITDEYDPENDLNSTTTTTTTTTRRSTYTFPTRNRITPSTRRPWPTERTSTRKSIINTDDLHDDERKYFRNIRKFFKTMWDDIKSFFRNLSVRDFIKAIQQLFSRNNED